METFKRFSVSLLAFSMFLISAVEAQAALVNVDVNGIPSWSVLSYEVETGEEKNVEVRSVVNREAINPNTKIALTRDEGQVLLTVDEEEIDISGYESEIVEVEEIDIPKRVAILANNDGFSIQQRGVTANTEFPITVNTPEKKISVQTDSGIRYLSILPYDAVIQIVRANIIKDLSEGDSVTLVENEDGEVVYRIKGKNDLNVLRFVDLSVDILVEISALDGKVVEVEKPLWYAIADFLIV